MTEIGNILANELAEDHDGSRPRLLEGEEDGGGKTWYNGFYPPRRGDDKDKETETTFLIDFLSPGNPSLPTTTSSSSIHPLPSSSPFHTHSSTDATKSSV